MRKDQQKIKLKIDTSGLGPPLTWDEWFTKHGHVVYPGLTREQARPKVRWWRRVLRSIR